MIEIKNPNWREKFSNRNDIIIAGASGAGKSTIFGLLSESNLDRDFHFHKRYITRPSRNDDITSENISMSVEHFFSEKFTQSIDFYWSKPLPGGDVFYAFKKVRPNYNIFCCNNEILEYDNTIRIRTDVLKTSLIIQVYCSLEERTKRLQLRSPKLTDLELNYRLKEVKYDLLSKCDLLIYNEQKSPAEIVNKLIEFISS